MPKAKKSAARRNRARGQPRNGRAINTILWNTVSGHAPKGRLVTGNRVYRCTQFVEYGNQFTSSGGGEVDGAKYFILNDLTQVSSFTSLFDQYKIEEIEIWWSTTASGLVGASDNTRWLNVIDYDDANALTFNQLLQYPNVEDLSRNEGCYRRFRPHIATAAYNAGSPVFSGFANETGWIDSGSPSVQHYGAKVALSATASTYVLTLRARFHLAFRNVI